MSNIQGYYFLLPLLLIYSSACRECVAADHQKLASLSRKSFPPGFIFGTASSAYQYEGAAYEDGKGRSIWDTFVEKYPDKIKDRGSGLVADDSYHRYKEDVAIMKEIGLDAYRFSISWSRLLPCGTISGGVNQEGIAYYNNLINDLLANGLQPFITLFHWDLPQTLEDEYGGFLSPRIVNDFQTYVELCFKTFGDRVKNWITVNEPVTYANAGYSTGEKAPGRCSKWISLNCDGGDSATEPYTVAHHLILAHAAAVKVYREKYQSSQKGQIGITLSSIWTLPLSNSTADHMATSRALIFTYDWLLEPLKSGSYPLEMVQYVGGRMPSFTKEQSLMVQGSYDFVGVNYYTTYYVFDVPCKKENLSYSTDACASYTGERNGTLIGPMAGSDWLYIYPKGILHLLLYTKHKLNNPIIYITENGVDEINDGSLSLEDDMRINYYSSHLLYVQSAIKNGVNVKGYFAWSLLDNFEWEEGYTVRFGIVYVDYKDGLERYLKTSAIWFRELLNSTVIVEISNNVLDFHNEL